jgi:hypothetical protein
MFDADTVSDFGADGQPVLECDGGANAMAVA